MLTPRSRFPELFWRELSLLFYLSGIWHIWDLAHPYQHPETFAFIHFQHEFPTHHLRDEMVNRRLRPRILPWDNPSRAVVHAHDMRSYPSQHRAQKDFPLKSLACCKLVGCGCGIRIEAEMAECKSARPVRRGSGAKSPVPTSINHLMSVVAAAL